MPCFDGGPDNNRELYANREEENKKLESLLCSACRALDKYEFDFDLNPRLSEWWARHKKEDEAKEKAELTKNLHRKMIKEISKKPVKDLTQDDLKLLKMYGYIP
jgi:hypothetical protein